MPNPCDGCPPPDRTKSNKQPLATQVTRATIPLPPTSRRGDATGRAIPAPGSSWPGKRGDAHRLCFLHPLQTKTTEGMGSNTPRLLKRHGHSCHPLVSEVLSEATTVSEAKAYAKQQKALPAYLAKQVTRQGSLPPSLSRTTYREGG